MNKPNTFDDAPFRYYAMIPHIVTEAKLSGIALKLYLWYKRVCGESGSCYQTLKTVAVGCDISHVSVLKGRKELEDRGFIRVVKTGSKGMYKIDVHVVNIWQENVDWCERDRPSETDEQAGKADPPDRYSKCTGPVNEVSPKNNSLKKNQKKKGGGRTAAPSRNGNSLPEDSKVSGFDTKAARHLKGTLEKYKAGIRRVREETLAGVISRLRVNEGIPQNRIRRYLEWYRGHYGDKFAVKMYKRDDLLKRWEQHENAMIGIEGDNGHVIERELPDPQHNHLVCDVRRAFFDKFSPQAPAFQNDVDELLVEMGRKPGEVRGSEI